MGSQAKMLRTVSTKIQTMHPKKPTKPKYIHLKKPTNNKVDEVYCKSIAVGAMGGGMFGFVAEPSREHIFPSTVLFAIIGFVAPIFVPIVVVGVPARATYWYFQANMPSQPKNE